jgi:hypothetical protein
MPYRYNPDRRPVDGRSRERMRTAQRLEAEALGAVSRMTQRLDAETAKLDRMRREREVIIARASLARCVAVARLTEISGVDRAALLLAEPKAEVRRACREAAAGVQERGDDTRAAERGGTTGEMLE